MVEANKVDHRNHLSSLQGLPISCAGCLSYICTAGGGSPAGYIQYVANSSFAKYL